MKDLFIRSLTDDGFGRELPLKIKGSQFVTLKRKEEWLEVKEPGDYAWSTWAETFEMLVLVCPFCGFEAPMPWLIKTNCKDPLDIAQELFCKNCVTFFHIINGAAYKSWIPLEEFKKCLLE